MYGGYDSFLPPGVSYDYDNYQENKNRHKSDYAPHKATAKSELLTSDEESFTSDDERYSTESFSEEYDDEEDIQERVKPNKMKKISSLKLKKTDKVQKKDIQEITKKEKTKEEQVGFFKVRRKQPKNQEKIDENSKSPEKLDDKVSPNDIVQRLNRVGEKYLSFKTTQRKLIEVNKAPRVELNLFHIVIKNLLQGKNGAFQLTDEEFNSLLPFKSIFKEFIKGRTSLKRKREILSTKNLLFKLASLMGDLEIDPE